MSPGMRSTVAAALITVGSLLAVSLAYKLFQWQWYLGAVPMQIEVDGVVSVVDSSGFREGCGAAVFEMSKGMQERLQEQGAAALADARQGRNRSGAYSAFGTWRETSAIEHGGEPALHLSGMDCGGLDDELQQQIFSAVAKPGSYYATASESGLIVIPSLQIVVFTFLG